MLVRRQELGRAPETWKQDETYSVGYHTRIKMTSEQSNKTAQINPHRPVPPNGCQILLFPLILTPFPPPVGKAHLPRPSPLLGFLGFYDSRFLKIEFSS